MSNCKHTAQGVGASLLANAACQAPSISDWQQKARTLSLSGLSRSKDRSPRQLLQGIVAGHKSCDHRRFNVGASLLAIAACQAPSISDRQQKALTLQCPGIQNQKIAAFGSSYMGLGAFSKRLVGCQAAIAGKPAPTKINSRSHPLFTTQHDER